MCLLLVHAQLQWKRGLRRVSDARKPDPGDVPLDLLARGLEFELEEHQAQNDL